MLSAHSDSYAQGVTRIIAGAARSRVLEVPSDGTRPTSDRVKEALFSAWESRYQLSGSRVLDLFAGSGAVALEAVSRGASAAVLVESNPRAAAIARRNAEVVASVTGVTARVVTSTVAASASRLGSEQFDLIFVDPPYEVSAPILQGALEVAAAHASATGVIVVERSSRSVEPEWPDGWASVMSKKYGETTLWWAERI